jgi:hypothetical protein
MGFGTGPEVNTMLDEFDDLVAPLPRPAAGGSSGDVITRHRIAAARLVSRAYRSASEPLRADMLACLLRPLGTLSMAAVASGAFAGLLLRQGAMPDSVSSEDALRYSSDQIRELALFVHEVNPEAIQQIGNLLTHNATTLTALSASALVLLYRRLQPAPAPLAPRPTGQPDDPAGATGSAAPRRP